MFITLPSILLKGLKARPVLVEIDVGRGMPSFNIIGLASTSIQEARPRIRSAIRNCGHTFPYNQRVLINLAPAHLEKEGSYFDLAMACGLVLAESNIDSGTIAEIKKTLVIGELGLKGEVRPVDILCPLLAGAYCLGFEKVIIGEEDAEIARRYSKLPLLPAKTLTEVVNHFLGIKPIEILKPCSDFFSVKTRPLPALESIKGQALAKRALFLSAVGGHHLAFWGPPGSGKTLLGSELINLLPDLNEERALEVMSIYSLIQSQSERINEGLCPPLRTPHHSSSMVSLIGGGQSCLPGEASLAHGGVLFLDELLEFQRQALEALREPMERKIINVSRAKGHVQYPADFILVGAFNPCHCGYFGSSDHECACPPASINSYRSKLSGPLMDRIDIFVEVRRVKGSDLFSDFITNPVGVNIRDEVVKVREFREKRRLKVSDDEITLKAKRAIAHIMSSYKLSARGAKKLIGLSRTIADSEYKEEIEDGHIAEAVQYRTKNLCDVFRSN